MKKNEKASEFRREAVKDLLKLASLLRQESKNYFAIGDEIAVLIEHKAWKISELAQYFRRSRSRLSEIYHTAKTFGQEQRDFSFPFAHYEYARQASKDFNINPFEALNQVEKMGLTNQRDVTSYFAKKEREKQNYRSADLAIWRKVGRQELIDRCHNEDCRNVASRLGDGIVKIVDFDEPYGEYGTYKNGHYHKSVAALDEFDSRTNAEVVALINDMMGIMIKKMSKNGVMLLWRPGGIADPLHNEITAAADKYGWEIFKILTWDKGKPKLGSGKEPYASDTENIWILNRRGDKLENHDNSSRSVMLHFAPITQRLLAALESHAFMKPLDLYKFLINKHSFGGELVFDACGCSGNCSIAALQLNRQFVYCEVNRQNYEFGSRRIHEALKVMQTQVG